MKTFKEFLTTTEEYREPNLEKMRRKVDKISRDSDEYKKVSDFFHQEREKDIYKKKPVSRNPNRRAYYRDTEGNIKRGYHSGDLLSLQNKHKFDKKKRTQELGRREQNIRAKINQYHADPLGYMAKDFGLGRNDYGMQMRRSPKRKKVEEGYKEPNLERMGKQARKFENVARNLKRDMEHEFHNIERRKENLYREKPKDDVKGGKGDGLSKDSAKKHNVYRRTRMEPYGVGRRYHKDDLESMNRYQKFRKKQLSRVERQAKNIAGKKAQYDNDPIGYTSPTMGGPIINPEDWRENKRGKKRK